MSAPVVLPSRWLRLRRHMEFGILTLAVLGEGTKRSAPLQLSAPLQTGVTYVVRFHRTSNRPNASATLFSRFEPINNFETSMFWISYT